MQWVYNDNTGSRDETRCLLRKREGWDDYQGAKILYNDDEINKMPIINEEFLKDVEPQPRPNLPYPAVPATPRHHT